MSDLIEALNLITSSKIHELYSRQDTEDPLVLRKKAADFRKGYGNWRAKKSKGARGETNYLTDHSKLHAHDVRDEEEMHSEEIPLKVDHEVREETLDSIGWSNAPLRAVLEAFL